MPLTSAEHAAVQRETKRRRNAWWQRWRAAQRAQRAAAPEDQGADYAVSGSHGYHSGGRDRGGHHQQQQQEAQQYAQPARKGGSMTNTGSSGSGNVADVQRGGGTTATIEQPTARSGTISGSTGQYGQPTLGALWHKVPDVDQGTIQRLAQQMEGRFDAKAFDAGRQDAVTLQNLQLLKYCLTHLTHLAHGGTWQGGGSGSGTGTGTGTAGLAGP